jgi:hypothetical protein
LGGVHGAGDAGGGDDAFDDDEGGDAGGDAALIWMGGCRFVSIRRMS